MGWADEGVCLSQERLPLVGLEWTEPAEVVPSSDALRGSRAFVRLALPGLGSREEGALALSLSVGSAPCRALNESFSLLSCVPFRGFEVSSARASASAAFFAASCTNFSAF